MNNARQIIVPATRHDGRAAHVNALPRVTASMVEDHGSYEKARRWLESAKDSK